MGAAPVPRPGTYQFQILPCLWAPLHSSEGWISHKWIWSCKYMAPKMMENHQMRSLETKGPESCVVLVEEYKRPSSVSKTLTSCLHFNIELSFAHLVKWNLWQVQSKEHVQVCSRTFRVEMADIVRSSWKTMLLDSFCGLLCFVLIFSPFFFLR